MTTAALDTQPDLPRFIELLTRQRDLYRRLHELAHTQQATLDEQGAEAMLAVLSQRQVFVDALTRLNADLAPYQADWPGFSARLDDAARTQVRQLVDDVDTLLAGVLKCDEQAKHALATAQQGVGGELRRATRAGHARAAYGQAPRPAGGIDPRFADRQG
jgi:hypothetical protein